MDVFEILNRMQEFDASDVYITTGVPVTWRGTKFHTVDKTPLEEQTVIAMMAQLTTEEERKRFIAEKELNLAIVDKKENRYRANFFYQQSQVGMVIRKVNERIPTIEELNLSPAYRDAVMEGRGLVLVVGMSGSGKSTSIASMLNYRNLNGSGHIITIEDPIEYVHKNRGCIFTQREVGFDTNSWDSALKNALRQRPDVIFIGEIRDAETMAQAINFAETGHLCIATLHATSASQAIERVANFFPLNLKDQYLYSLAHVLKYVFAQRLVKTVTGLRNIPAIEILQNVGFIKPLITAGKIPEIREMIGKHSDIGMMNFEHSLLGLLNKNIITPETAISESDNPDNMRLNIMKIKVKSAKDEKYGGSSF